MYVSGVCTTTGVLQEAALRAFYLPGDAQDYELHEIGGTQSLHSDLLNCNSAAGSRSQLKDGGEAWFLRAKDRDADVIKVYVGWPR